MRWLSQESLDPLASSPGWGSGSDYGWVDERMDGSGFSCSNGIRTCVINGVGFGGGGAGLNRGSLNRGSINRGGFN